LSGESFVSRDMAAGKSRFLLLHHAMDSHGYIPLDFVLLHVLLNAIAARAAAVAFCLAATTTIAARAKRLRR